MEYRLRKAWQVYLEPSVLWNITNGGHQWKTANHTDDGVGFTKTNAYCQLALGVNYKFMTSNGTHNFKLYDIGDLNRKINDLNNKINDQEAQLAAKPKEVIKEVIKEVEKKVLTNNQYVVFFAKNNADIDENAKDILNSIDKSASVKIVATASPEGNSAYNKYISQKRADAIKDYLTQNGVQVSSAEGVGVTGNTSNRAAIITVNE